MDSYERKNRIEEALRIRGMKQVELAEKTGISRGTINNWLKNKYQPKQKALYTLAKALGVSEMWLAGYDVPMERPEAQVKMDALAQVVNVMRKNERLTNLVINLSSLNEAQLATVESMVNELAKVNHQH